MRAPGLQRARGADARRVRAGPRQPTAVRDLRVTSCPRWRSVVEEHDRYVVVEKVGEAGDEAERSDPRSSATASVGERCCGHGATGRDPTDISTGSRDRRARLGRSADGSVGVGLRRRSSLKSMRTSVPPAGARDDRHVVAHLRDQTQPRPRPGRSARGCIPPPSSATGPTAHVRRAPRSPGSRPAPRGRRAATAFVTASDAASAPRRPGRRSAPAFAANSASAARAAATELGLASYVTLRP